MHDFTFRDLLNRTLIALTLCAFAVAACYAWVDRPTAFYVHDHGLNQVRVFKWLTYPPPWMQSWSPLILVLLMFRRAFAPISHYQRVLLVACLSLLVANEFRTSLGDLFGRYWPETWFNDNPSLIGNGTYGFHPFVHGDDLGSFPSGALGPETLGFAWVWWLAVPRSRWLCSLACPPLLASLVLMNYHFVGDVVAGSTLGAIVAAYAVKLAGLKPQANRQTIEREVP